MINGTVKTAANDDSKKKVLLKTPYQQQLMVNYNYAPTIENKTWTWVEYSKNLAVYACNSVIKDTYWFETHDVFRENTDKYAYTAKFLLRIPLFSCNEPTKKDIFNNVLIPQYLLLKTKIEEEKKNLKNKAFASFGSLSGAYSILSSNTIKESEYFVSSFQILIDTNVIFKCINNERIKKPINDNYYINIKNPANIEEKDGMFNITFKNSDISFHVSTKNKIFGTKKGVERKDWKLITKDKAIELNLDEFNYYKMCIPKKGGITEEKHWVQEKY